MLLLMILNWFIDHLTSQLVLTALTIISLLLGIIKKIYSVFTSVLKKNIHIVGSNFYSASPNNMQYSVFAKYVLLE